MDKIKIHLRETHLCQDGDRIFPINYIFFDVNKGEKFKLFVVGGVVYTAISSNNYMRVLAPIVETPSELSGCPYFELVEIQNDKQL